MPAALNTTPQHEVEYLPPTGLHPYERNGRRHSAKQIVQIVRSSERFGFTNPVLISDEGEIIAAHGRVAAAKKLEMEAVPFLKLSHLSAA